MRIQDKRVREYMLRDSFNFRKLRKLRKLVINNSLKMHREKQIDLRRNMSNHCRKHN